MMQNCLSSSTAYLAKLRVNRSAIFLPAVTLTVIALQQYTGIPVSQFYLVHITKEGNFPNGDTQFTAGPQTSGSTENKPKMGNRNAPRRLLNKSSFRTKQFPRKSFRPADFKTA